MPFKAIFIFFNSKSQDYTLFSLFLSYDFVNRLK